MKKFKEITAIIAIIATLAGCAKVTAEPTAEKSKDLTAPVVESVSTTDTTSVQLRNSFDSFDSLYEPDELTLAMLENRNGAQIVEHIVGVVLDSEGNGKVLNTASSADYIAYGDYVPGSKEGDIIETFLVYDRDCNYADCFTRMDFIVSPS